MKEQANNPHGMREASIKWHFLAFYVSGKISPLFLSCYSILINI